MRFSFKELLVIVILTYALSTFVTEAKIKEDLLKDNKIEFLFLDDVRVDNVREITYEKIEKELK